MNADGSGLRIVARVAATRHSCLVARRAEDRLPRLGRWRRIRRKRRRKRAADVGAQGKRSCLVARRAANRFRDYRQALRRERRRKRAPDSDAAGEGRGRCLSCMVARRAKAPLPGGAHSAPGCGYCSRLYVLNADGSGLRDLTRKLGGGGPGAGPLPILSGLPTGG